MCQITKIFEDFCIVYKFSLSCLAIPAEQMLPTALATRLQLLFLDDLRNGAKIQICNFAQY